MPFSLVLNPDYRPVALEKGQVEEGKMYEDMAVKLFEKESRKPVSVMGKDDPTTPHIEEPATDHLDMGLTPVDDRTCFLGNVDLARRLLAGRTQEERKKTEEQLGKLLGRDVKIDDFLESARNNNNQHDFDAYRRTLVGKGYRVIDVPHLAPSTHDVTEEPYFSYNNCLMERFEKDGHEFRRVFLPVYGVDALDNYAIECFKSQGFEVHPIPLGRLSRHWGALRCISNWLERSPRG